MEKFHKVNKIIKFEYNWKGSVVQDIIYRINVYEKMRRQSNHEKDP